MLSAGALRHRQTWRLGPAPSSTPVSLKSSRWKLGRSRSSTGGCSANAESGAGGLRVRHPWAMLLRFRTVLRCAHLPWRIAGTRTPTLLTAASHMAVACRCTSGLAAGSPAQIESPLTFASVRGYPVVGVVGSHHPTPKGGERSSIGREMATTSRLLPTIQAGVVTSSEERRSLKL